MEKKSSGRKDPPEEVIRKALNAEPDGKGRTIIRFAVSEDNDPEH